MQGFFVDQTDYIAKLIDETAPKVQAVVPRRFSKSTYLDLIEEMCGSDAKAIFAGTHLERTKFFQEKWRPPYPVLKFEFGLFKDPAALEDNLLSQIEGYFGVYNFSMSGNASVGEKLRRLLDHIMRAGNPAVVLIDEYDKPVHEASQVNLRILDNFFAALKGNRLITKLIVFGTHKNLNLIGDSTNDTQDVIQTPPFYNMFGFTKAHLEEIFSDLDPSYAQFLPEHFQTSVKHADNPKEFAAQKLEWIMKQLETHYDGYRFSGFTDAAKLYNPYSVLMFRQNRGRTQVYSDVNIGEFPGIDGILTKYPKLLESTVECDQFGSTKVNNELVTKKESGSIKLLWELGVMTIESADFNTNTTMLKNTNNEMRTNFQRLVMNSFLSRNKEYFLHFKKAAEELNVNGMGNALVEILAPRETHMFSEIYLQSALYEGLYEAKLDPKMELYTGQRKRIDLHWSTSEFIYVFELKLNRTVDEAIEQLKTRRYCYDSLISAKKNGKSVVAVGMNYAPGVQLSLIYLAATLLESGEITYWGMRKFEAKLG